MQKASLNCGTAAPQVIEKTSNLCNSRRHGIPEHLRDLLGESTASGIPNRIGVRTPMLRVVRMVRPFVFHVGPRNCSFQGRTVQAVLLSAFC